MASAFEGFQTTKTTRNLKTDQFIICSYRFGFSVLLIQKILIERGYNFSPEEIRSVLLENEIQDNSFNCSRQSHHWKHYLAYIIDKFDPPFLEEFKNKALEEATRFYGINEEILTNYWNNLCEFHVQAPLGHRGDPNFNTRYRPWVFSAFIRFGYNPFSLSAYLEKIGFDISSTHLVRLFHEQATIAEDKSLVLIMAPKFPQYTATPSLFWRASYELFGNEGIPTIIEMSEMVGGYRIKEDDIRNAMM